MRHPLSILPLSLPLEKIKVKSLVREFIESIESWPKVGTGRDSAELANGSERLTRPYLAINRPIPDKSMWGQQPPVR